MAKWQVILAACALVAGVVLAQVVPPRAQAVTNSRSATLVDTVREMEETVRGLETELSDARTELETLQEQRAGEQGVVQSLKTDLETQQDVAGMTQMTSSGIIVSLDDNQAGANASQAADPENYRPSDYIIHDKNLLYLVNDLRSAGALAIAVNDQRVVSMTDIRCVGTVIMVNSTRVAPPFQITALGNAARLRRAVENSMEYSFLKTNHFPVNIKTVIRATVPAYAGNINASHLSLDS